MSAETVNVKLTCDQASVVIEALAAKCDKLKDEWTCDKWGRDSAERRVGELAAKLTRLEAKRRMDGKNAKKAIEETHRNLSAIKEGK